jgi:hypothetical protein
VDGALRRIAVVAGPHAAAEYDRRAGDDVAVLDLRVLVAVEDETIRRNPGDWMYRTLVRARVPRRRPGSTVNLREKSAAPRAVPGFLYEMRAPDGCGNPTWRGPRMCRYSARTNATEKQEETTA